MGRTPPPPPQPARWAWCADCGTTYPPSIGHYFYFSALDWLADHRRPSTMVSRTLGNSLGPSLCQVQQRHRAAIEGVREKFGLDPQLTAISESFGPSLNDLVAYDPWR